MYREPVYGELLGCVQGEGVDIILIVGLSFIALINVEKDNNSEH